MKQITALFITFLILLAALSGCARTGATGGQPQMDEIQASADDAEPAGPAPSSLKVVTTIFPPYDFVREIAGDRVELSMLLSPGSESHSYDPTPQDIIAIQECDLFLYVGGEGDRWVDRILESADATGVTILTLIDMVETVEEELVEGMEPGHDDDHGGENHGHEDGEDHDDHEHEEEAELDEHVWTAPANAMAIVEQISHTLQELDRDNEELYRERTTAYLEQLSALDLAYRQAVDGATRHTLVFGDRFPFRYLADAYGLEYYAAFPGCSTETEASAATVAFLIDKARDEEIPVVFHIELSNEKMADTICEGSGASKRLLHSAHNVTRDEFRRGATYLELMTQNLEHLKEALS